MNKRQLYNTTKEVQHALNFSKQLINNHHLQVQHQKDIEQKIKCDDYQKRINDLEKRIDNIQLEMTKHYYITHGNFEEKMKNNHFKLGAILSFAIASVYISSVQKK
jgi:hypothetical protein